MEQKVKERPHNAGFGVRRGVSRGTPRRNLEVLLPSEPLRNPARTPSPRHVKRHSRTPQRTGEARKTIIK